MTALVVHKFCGRTCHKASLCAGLVPVSLGLLHEGEGRKVGTGLIPARTEAFSSASPRRAEVGTPAPRTLSRLCPLRAPEPVGGLPATPSVPFVRVRSSKLGQIKARVSPPASVRRHPDDRSSQLWIVARTVGHHC
jgi:hypothetical protein